MQFVLMGFNQNAGFRIYSFEGVEGGQHTEFTVGVELSLLVTYGIRIQELPLLCRKLLERRTEGNTSCALTFTARDMRCYADDCASAREAALKKKPHRGPISHHPGVGWRAHAADTVTTDPAKRI